MQKALVVEDHQSSQIWLSALLVEAFPCIEVDIADKLAPAKALIARNLFDLVLLDISLPDGNGITLINTIRATCPNTYIVITTIFDDDAHLFQAFEEGAQGFLLKDQPRNKLINQLAGILHGEPPLSPSITRRLIRHFRAAPSRAQPLQPPPQPPPLTVREHEILTLLAQSYSRGTIANMLTISEHTVGTHIKHIYRKLGVSNRTESIMTAIRLGIIHDI